MSYVEAPVAPPLYLELIQPTIPQSPLNMQLIHAEALVADIVGSHYLSLGATPHLRQ